MQDMNFIAPVNMSEATALLAGYGSKAIVFAGGTDIMPRINSYEIRPEAIIYLGKLGLDTVEEVDGGLEIGARTTIATLLECNLIAEKAPILKQAAFSHSSPAIRATGTIGGNIMNASPAADMVVALFALDAELILDSTCGERTVSIYDFFTGPGETVCTGGEILRSIRIPAYSGGTAFIKLGRRRAQALAVVSVGVRLDVVDGVCKTARVALGSVAPTVMRCPKTEQKLEGSSIDADLLRACAESAIAESSPISDVRASAWYRTEAGKGMIRQALFAAAGIEYTD